MVGEVAALNGAPCCRATTDRYWSDAVPDRSATCASANAEANRRPCHDGFLDTPATVHVDVVSDVVCPWCYIGKRRLETALALNPDIAVDINWRPYFLNPWIPREGIDRQTYLETKFGSAERYERIAERVAAAAAMEGLTYAPDKISRQPNTLDCHRLILWSRSATDPGAHEAAADGTLFRRRRRSERSARC